MAKRKEVVYDIKFNPDFTSLDLMKEALDNIQHMQFNYFVKLNGTNAMRSEFNQIKATADQLETAINNCFNPKTNTMNFTRLNSVLNATGMTVEGLSQKFSKMGREGQKAMLNFAESILTANTPLQKTEGLISRISGTLLDAAKWSVAYGTINGITNGIKSAWNYAISLDASLNDIRVVTGKSYEDMEKFADSANRAAKALGTTTRNYAKGALIYYQQGLGEKDVQARTEVTAKTANVTGQSMADVSEQLTAVWNGFQVKAEEAESYVDRLAAVAAASASDLEELSTAMSRVASSASTMGIDIDQLTAQIATIESVTRQDAASIGTALKTIYARMGDLAIGAEDEFGVALGDVSGQMKQMGIDILDSAGNMRDMGTVIEEVAQKWGGWTKAQQQAAAVALAGKRQYNNLFALFENWDMYESNKEISKNSLGELQKQQDTYMERTEAHIKQLTASAEDFKDAFFDNKSMNLLIDGLKTIVDLAAGLLKGMGGGGVLLTQLVTTITALNSGKIAEGLVKPYSSKLEREANKNQISSRDKIVNDLKQTGEKVDDDTLSKMVEIEDQRKKYAEVLTQQENERYNILINETKELRTQKKIAEGYEEELGKYLSSNKDNVLTEGVSFLDGFPGSGGKKVTGKMNFEKFESLSEASKDKIAKNIANEEVSLGDRKDRLKTYLKDKDKYDITPTETNKKRVNDRAKAVLEDVDTEMKTGLLSNKRKQSLGAALNAYNIEATNVKLTGGDDAEAKKALEKVVTELTEAYEEQERVLYRLGKATGTMANETAAATAKLGENEEKLKNLDKEGQFKIISKSITEIVSGMVAMVGAINSIHNTISVFQDDTSTAEERVAAVAGAVMAAIPVIMMIVPMVKTVMSATAKEVAVGTAKIEAAMGVIGLILMAISAAITIVLAIVNSIESPMDKAQRQLDEAKEKLETFSSALDDAKQGLQNLYESVDKYKDVKSSISDLTAGTQEWRDAILETNQAAMELISNYGITDWSVDENGVINISDEAMDEAIKEQQKEVAVKSSMVASQKLQVANAQSNLSIEKMKQTTRDNTDGFQEGASKGALAGGVTAMTPLGVLAPMSVVGVGAAVGISEGVKAQKKQDEQVQNTEEYAKILAEKYAQVGDKIFEDTTKPEGSDLSYKEMFEYLDQIDDSMKEQIIALGENTKATRALELQQAQAFLQNSEKYQESKDKGAYSKLYASALHDQKGLDDFKDEDMFNKHGNSTDKLNEILKENGLGGQVSVNSYDAKEDKVVYNYNGKRYEESRAEMKARLSNDIKQKQLEGQENNIASFVNQYADSKYIDFANFGKNSTDISGLTSWTQKELDTFQMDDAAIESAMAAAGYGPDEKKAFLEKIQAARELSQRSIEESLNSIAEVTNNFANKGDYTDVQLKNIKSGLENTFGVLGGAAADQLAEVLNGEDPETAAKIAAAVSNTDLTSATAVEDFVAAAKSMGVEIDISDNKYSAFITSIQESGSVLAQSVKSFNSLKNSIAILSSVTKDLDFGSVISDEDYKKLLAIYSGAKDWFVETVDGYQLIKGSGNELYKKAYSERFGSLAEATEHYETLNGISGKIDNLNFDTEGVSNNILRNKIKNSLSPKMNENELNAFLKQAGVSRDQWDAIIKNGVTDNNRSWAVKILQTGSFLKENGGTLDATRARADRITSAIGTKSITGLLAELDSYEKDGMSKKEGIKLRNAILTPLLNEAQISIEMFDKMSGTTLQKIQKIQQQTTNSLLKENLENAKENLTGKALEENLNKILDIYKTDWAYYEELGRAKLAGLDKKFGGMTYAQLLEDRTKNIQGLTEDEIKEYDESLELLKTAQESEDNYYQAALDKFTTVLEDIQSLADYNKQIKEFTTNYLKSDGTLRKFWEIGKKDSDYYGNLKDQYASSLKDAKSVFETAKKELEDLEAIRPAEDSDEYSTWYKKYKEAYTAMLEKATAYEDEQNNVFEAWKSGWEDVISQADKYSEKLQELNDILDQQIELNNILGKMGGNQNANLIEKQFRNIQKSFEAQRDTYEGLLNSLSGELSQAEQEQYNLAVKGYLDSAMEYYNSSIENFSNAIENIYNKYGIEKFSTMWDLTKQMSESTLNVADTKLNKNNLRRQYQSAIDTSNSLAAQRKLKKVMEEQLAILEKKDKLTQREVDRANAVYELTLKQIALEESQRNASKMQLVRDSSGNLTYAFVQDQDSYAKAKQEEEEAAAALFNSDESALKDQIDQFYSLTNEAQSKLKDAGNNKELLDKIYEQYYGEDGLITRAKDSLPELVSNLRQTGLENGYDTTDSTIIAEAEKIAQINVKEMGDEVKSTIINWSEKIDDVKKALDDIINKIDFTELKVETDINKDTITKIAGSLSGLLTVLKSLDGKITVPENGGGNGEGDGSGNNGRTDGDSPKPSTSSSSEPNTLDLEDIVDVELTDAISGSNKPSSDIPAWPDQNQNKQPEASGMNDAAKDWSGANSGKLIPILPPGMTIPLVNEIASLFGNGAPKITNSVSNSSTVTNNTITINGMTLNNQDNGTIFSDLKGLVSQYTGMPKL